MKQVHDPRSSVAVEVLCGSPFGLHTFCVQLAALCSMKPSKLLVQRAAVLLLRAIAGGRSRVWSALERLRGALLRLAKQEFALWYSKWSRL